jgi:hypothetical protein
MPARIGRVLAVVRMLIGYGKDLAEAMHRRAGKPVFVTATLPFGTLDPMAILARIACGLSRAVALEARLAACAARGRDLSPLAEPPAGPTKPAASRQPKPPAPRPQRASRAAPDGFPTAAQIAAEVRRRPVGAVVADICRDLGLLPGQCDREFLKELSAIITEYGGKLSRWVKVIDRRIKQTLIIGRKQQEAAPAASTPHTPHTPPPNAAATGPPWDPGLRTVPA